VAATPAKDNLPAAEADDEETSLFGRERVLARNDPGAGETGIETV